MSALIDLTNNVFGRLTVLSANGRDSKGRALWLCSCSCGNPVTAKSYYLLRGKVKSCGCLKKEVSAATGRAHMKHGMHLTPEYAAWRAMRDRCLNHHNQNYHNYGGRGITVCQEWEEFKDFFADMGLRPSPLHSLERKENDGNYCATNCRWATQQEQCNNRRTSVYFEVDGVRRTKTEWAQYLGISFFSLTKRIKKWGLDRALTTPKKA